MQSIKQQCLDHFIAVGEEHLNHLVHEYVMHFNAERPHQANENLPPMGDWSNAPTDGAIQCRMRLGGLLKHYYRQAA